MKTGEIIGLDLRINELPISKATKNTTVNMYYICVLNIDT